MTAEPSALAPAQPREGLVRDLVPPRLFVRAPLLAIGVAGAAACAVTMLVAAALPAGEARWGGQLQMTMASVVAAAITWRASQLATSRRQRAFRFHLFLSSVMWLAVQLVSLAGSARPDVVLQPLEYALLLGWFVVVARCWHLALRERLGRVEVAAVYLDSTAVFITIAAGVLLMLGPVAAVNPGAARLLVYAMIFGGVIGGMSVVYLALTPVQRPAGWAVMLPGMVALGIGLGWRTVVGEPGWHPSDLLIVGGLLLTVYGAATWDDDTDVDERMAAVASRIREVLPLVAVAVAAGLLLANETLLPRIGHGLAFWVDLAVAAVLVNSVVRQTLLLHERSRLLAAATEASARERALVTDLVASEQRFRTLVQHSSDVFLILAPDGTVLYQSPAVERVLGYPDQARIGHKMFELTHPDDLEFVQGVIGELLQTPGAMRTIELRSRHADGSWRVLEATGRNMLTDPVIGGVVVNYRDITERKALESQLVHEAFHDPLTGLSNRALFSDRVGHALTRRDALDRIAVLFMDVDDFKTINDSLGHSAGDMVLVAVAERVRACLRPEDTVSRLGGDEFAVLLEDADPGLTAQVAARMLATLRKPFEIGGKQVHLDASIGVAFASAEAQGADELLRNADVAMYTAKSRGKGRVQVFESSMHAAALTRLEMKADLERALEKRELRLRYQPVFDLRTRRLANFEALLRWRHPERGEVFPGEFVGLAEETGLIVPIGAWVLERACRQAQAWADAGHEIAVSVNVSARQLHEPEFVADVERILHKAKLPAGRLMLELTETSLMQDDEGRLRDLRSLGVQLAVDDFGTGYSSLSYLSRFPVDVLKIDRSFTAELGNELEESALVRSVVQLARAMNMETVAEGIERPEQLARVTALGCDYGQGFLLARPMDAIRATSLTRSGASLGSVEAAS